MKFLVDAQLPKSLSDLLNSRGHNSIHTLDLDQKNTTTDKAIIELVKKEKRIVITKDHDFLDSFLLRSEPEKLILVKTGNIPNKALLKLFDDNLAIIVAMVSRSPLIEVSTSEIAEHG